MALSFMVVDDLDIVSVAAAELEADPSPSVHGHGPLTFAVALELVKACALERAEIMQRLRNIEHQQQINRGVEVEAAKLVRPPALPDLAARRVAP